MKTKPAKRSWRGALVHFKRTLPFASSVHEFVFHLGYQGFEFPRWVRRLMAKSKLHRSWFSGYTGLGILSIIELTAPSDSAE